MTLPAEEVCLMFFATSYPEWLHCLNFCFVSGLKWNIHVCSFGTIEFNSSSLPAWSNIFIFEDTGEHNQGISHSVLMSIVALSIEHNTYNTPIFQSKFFPLYCKNSQKSEQQVHRQCFCGIQSLPFESSLVASKTDGLSLCILSWTAFQPTVKFLHHFRTWGHAFFVHTSLLTDDRYPLVEPLR